jgi:hypothetical protein
VFDWLMQSGDATRADCVRGCASPRRLQNRAVGHYDIH